MINSLPLSQVVNGFFFDKELTFSPNTTRNYKLHFERLARFLGDDPLFDQITTDQVRAFLNHLKSTQITPRGIAPRPRQLLSAKSLKNVHTGLSSLWTWAIEQGYAETHVVRAIKPPRPAQPPINVYTKLQIQDLLDATKYASPNRKKHWVQNRRPAELADRDQAIIFFLLDTGVRATELCKLCLSDVDLTGGTATVQNKGRLDGGEGKKRTVEFGKRCRRALWRYLNHRDNPGPSERLFTNRDGTTIDRRNLARLIKRLGRRAGIQGATCHRFRHTFATTFLQYDSNIYRLQRLMGHESLDMLRRYVHFVQSHADPTLRTSVADAWLR